MPRHARHAPGGLIYHVLNRGVGRMKLFEKDADYLAFLKCIANTLEVRPMRILSYCIMPNHWHLVLWPKNDGDLSAFMQRLTISHVRRWLEHRHAVGTGHVYQSRFKSFVMKSDAHLLSVCRYVERNPLRAKLVRRAENWTWSSLPTVIGRELKPLFPLTAPPVRRYDNWLDFVQQPQTAAEESAIRNSITTGRPLGDRKWQEGMCKTLGLPTEQRPRGRPRKVQDV